MTGEEMEREEQAAVGSMDEGNGVRKLYLRLAETFSSEVSLSKLSFSTFDVELYDWPTARDVDLELWGEGESFKLLVSGHGDGRVRWTDQLSGYEYGWVRLDWMALFWRTVRSRFPLEVGPDTLESEEEEYVDSLLADHFDEICALFAYARHMAVAAFDKFNEAFAELRAEAELFAGGRFPSMVEGGGPVQMAAVEKVRKAGTRRMADRLGIPRPGRAPKIAETEHDNLVLAALLDSKNDATTFNQKRVAKILGVTPRTLTSWAEYFGWEAYCGALLDKAQIDGVSPEAVAEKLALLDRQREDPPSESETPK